jgi:prevent-host-death family protein
MRQQISLREANQHLSRYIEAVMRGEEVIITRRSRPVARLVPVAQTKELTAAQRAAWKRTKERMTRGYNLGGAHFDRESVHER